MDEIRLLAVAEAELAARLEAIAWRVSVLKSATAGSSFHLNQSRGQFCADHWQPVIEQVNSHRILDAYRSFCSSFESQLELRVLSCDLREKATRLYVDILLRNVDESVNDQIATAIANEYADVTVEIQQAVDMLGTMREHFEQSIDSFKSELIRFKKKLSEGEEQSATLLGAPQTAYRLPLKSAFVEELCATGPKICKTGYKKRTKPFVPKKLGMVIGSSLNEMSPRAKMSQKINHKSARYVLPF